MKKKSKKRIFVIIAIIIVLIIAIFIIYYRHIRKEYLKNFMLDDAISFIAEANAQKANNILEDKDNIKCLRIYGNEGTGLYPNYGNYQGSIDISGEKPYIWLSDGIYYIKGTSDNLSIVDSNLNATTNCNMN